MARIFFKDERPSGGIDHVSQRCLIFKHTDTALIFTLPDGERFFLPAGDLINNQDPLRPYEVPADINPPAVKCVVNVVNNPGGGDNRLQCASHNLSDGETLVFDGTSYRILPKPTPKGCAGSVMAVAVLSACAVAACFLL